MTLGGRLTKGESARVLKASGGQQSLQGLGGGRGTQGARRKKGIPERGPLWVPVRPTGELEVEAGAKPGWPQSAGRVGGESPRQRRGSWPTRRPAPSPLS